MNFKNSKDKQCFIIALTKVVDVEDSDTSFSCTIDHMYLSLENLWKKALVSLDDAPLNIVPLGTGIPRCFKRNIESILFISQSFINISKEKRPCSKLTINVKKELITMSEYFELKRILNFLC